MKIFLEGNRPHFSAALKAVVGDGYLKPGVNDVPDEIGTALIDGCAADCARQEADIRKRLVKEGKIKSREQLEEDRRRHLKPGESEDSLPPAEPEPPLPADVLPKPTFRLAEKRRIVDTVAAVADVPKAGAENADKSDGAGEVAKDTKVAEGKDEKPPKGKK